MEALQQPFSALLRISRMFHSPKSIMIPLVFVCICQFVSACHASDSGTKTVQQNIAEVSSDSLQETEMIEVHKTRTPVWRGIIKGEDPLDSAADIYSESPSKPTGISEYQGLVFCIVELPLDEGQDDLSFEMDGMLMEKEMLRKHYQLSASFQLQRRVLENRLDYDSDCFRYATVYRLKDIQSLQK